MAKVISNKELTTTLSLTEYTDGFWLYDKTRGMNLSMKAKTTEDAFVEALTYYQGRLMLVETSLRDLEVKVENFVSLFKDDNDE